MKKINIGIVLIILALIGVVIIGYIEEINEVKEKENVSKFLKEYVSESTKYFMLEEEYRDIDKVISNEEYNKYLIKIKEELKKYVVSESLDDMLNGYKANLDVQLDGQYILKDYSKAFIEIKEFNLKNGYIYVIFNEIIEITKDNRMYATKDEKSGRYEGKVYTSSYNENYTEMLVLKKLENEYKVVCPMVGKMNPEYNVIDKW